MNAIVTGAKNLAALGLLSKTTMDHLEKYREDCRRDSRSDAELIGIVASCLTDPGDEQYWAALSVLHGRFGSEAFAQAQSWSRSPNADLRRAAADLLAQAHTGNPEFEQPAGDLLVEMLAHEERPENLKSLAFALGHNGHPGGVPWLVNLSHHAEEKVRQAVAYGLAGCDEPDAVAALIELSRDTNADVRDWATFALGSQTELDTPALREALWKRVGDTDAEIQGEAVVGLARLQDQRIWPIIDRLLKEPNVSYLAVEAAEKLPAPMLLEALRRFKARQTDRVKWLEETIDEAIQACGG